MVKVSMGQEYGVQLAALEFGVSPVFCSLLFSALEHAAIDQYARVFCNNVIDRAGDFNGRSMEIDLHLGPSNNRFYR
jgi:hypothetical protein